jgi:hypothetical protein
VPERAPGEFANSQPRDQPADLARFFVCVEGVSLAREIARGWAVWQVAPIRLDAARDCDMDQLLSALSAVPMAFSSGMRTMSPGPTGRVALSVPTHPMPSTT